MPTQKIAKKENKDHLEVHQWRDTKMCLTANKHRSMVFEIVQFFVVLIKTIRLPLLKSRDKMIEIKIFDS